MIRALRCLALTPVLAIVVALATATAASAAVWSSTAAFGSWSSGGYTLYNDVWGSGNAYETMLWMNKTGAVGPLGSEMASVSVGGYSWHVYKGSNGSNQVFSFVNTGSATSGTVNILAVLKWIESQGWFGNITLGNVQFGWEITSSSGGENFQVNSFSVSG